MNKHFFFKTLFSSITLLLVAGCAERNMLDLDTFIEETKKKHLGKVEALPAITPYESYSYQTYNRRDPFKPSATLVKPVQKKHSSNLQPNALRNKEDLEKYELRSLVMVGVMNNNGQNWAILKSPDNNIFRVKKGNYIGTNNGKILNISESNISLKEIVKDGSGWVERKNKLAINE